MTNPTTDLRQALITGLMELAGFYATHPDVSQPMFPKFDHCVLADNDDDGTAEVEAVAAALGVGVEYGVHVSAVREFAGVEFHVYYVTRKQAADHKRRWKIAEAAKVDTSPAAAAAEVAGDLAPKHEITVNAEADLAPIAPPTCEKTWPGHHLRDDVYRRHRCGQPAGQHKHVCQYCQQPHPGGRWPQ